MNKRIFTGNYDECNERPEYIKNILESVMEKEKNISSRIL